MQPQSQILLMIPLPTVNQAYAMLLSDESQKGTTASASTLDAPPITNVKNRENMRKTKE